MQKLAKLPYRQLRRLLPRLTPCRHRALVDPVILHQPRLYVRLQRLHRDKRTTKTSASIPVMLTRVLRLHFELELPDDMRLPFLVVWFQSVPSARHMCSSIWSPAQSAETAAGSACPDAWLALEHC